MFLRFPYLLRAPWLLCTLAVGACPASDGQDAPRLAPLAEVANVHTTRDGRLTASLPADLWVHHHSDALQATAPSGQLRLHLAWAPHEALLKASGRAKETLLARDWKAAGEQHFERAISLRFERGGPPEAPTHLRVLWIIDRGEALIRCDGIAEGAARQRLEAPLKTLCSDAGFVASPSALNAPSSGEGEGESADAGASTP